MDSFDKLFTNRQLVLLAVLGDLVNEARAKVLQDGGTPEYADAISVYLSFLVDKVTDRNSAVCSWDTSCQKIRNTFARAAMPMTWDYAEANPFSASTGSMESLLSWIVECLVQLPAAPAGFASQKDAQSDCGLRNVMVSTDPPYYDNIGYADLSDFFYVWMRKTLQPVFPELFRTMLVPKAEELVANPERAGGRRSKAKEFFENGMLEACRRIHDCTTEDIPVTVYYAYKQSDMSSQGTVSTGWETMLSALIQAGFSITGTWPMRTELANRPSGVGRNALATSIVLVCRKRPENAPACSRRDFLNALKHELRPALDKLRTSNIAPVDMAQSAIGPGMSIYSRYSSVLGADGEVLSVRDALRAINQELDMYLNDQDGGLDVESRFCVDLYTQFGFGTMPFGDADVLIHAKNTSVDRLRDYGVFEARKGRARLLTRDELPEMVEPDKGLWRITQQLTRAMEKDGIQGAARVAASATNAERARDLAYRLYSIADRKGWTQDAFAYNALVAEWPSVRSEANRLADGAGICQQRSMYDLDV